MVISAIALIAIVGSVLVRATSPTIPTNDALTVVARTVLQGEITPDASEGVDPATLALSPMGQECTEIQRQAGPLFLCWEAHRDPFDSDPVQDYYRLRVYGTFGGESGTGVRWVVVNARLVDGPSSNFFEAWPNYVFDGPCQDVDVALHSGGLPMSETLCGLTTGTTNRDDWSHRVAWNCTGCPFFADHADRAISLHEFVAVPAGTIPTWEISADLGS